MIKEEERGGRGCPRPGGGCTSEQGPWGSSRQCRLALGGVCVTSCRWAASWEVRGQKTQSLGEATMHSCRCGQKRPLPRGHELSPTPAGAPSLGRC